jgi:hypothetical protein
MNDLTPFNDQRQLPAGTNAGSIEIESQRAIAEARGQIQLAKMFPRSIAQATEELLEACKNTEFAAQAFYSVPNRGSGPSIRFAEEIARCYGNFEYGHRELSRDGGKSEVEVYAWDKEKNNYSKRQITVDHVCYSRSNGNTKLTDPNDIDNRIANVAAKQMRGRILALVSKSLVAIGIEACQKTIAGGGDGKSISSQIQKATKLFSNFGVKVAHLEAYLGHSLDLSTIDDVTDLLGVYNALREGAKVADYFSPPEKETPAIPEESGKSKLGQKAAESAKKPATKTKPEPKPVDKPAKVAQSSATSEDDDDDIDSMFD